MLRAERHVRARRRGRRAFTLIELLGVMVILGLMASVAFVSYEALVPASVLNSAVRELASTLQETRSEAIARSQPFWIQYYFESTDAHPRGYRVVTPFVASATGGIAMRPEDRIAQPFVPLPDGVEFKEITINGLPTTRGMAEVRFDPLGQATDHLIVLEHKPYGAIYTLEVQALTGLISFHDGEFRREPAKDADFGS